MLTFDEKGHVQPYEVISMTLVEVEEVFVKKMEDKKHRKELFGNYLRFLKDLKKEFPITFFQWIDGSFTTTKEKPGDMDVVSFIDYDYFIKKPGIINHFALNGKELYKVDAHFATTTSWRHRYFGKCQDDERYWKKIFGLSRADEKLIRHPKGIIKVNF